MKKKKKSEATATTENAETTGKKETTAKTKTKMSSAETMRLSSCREKTRESTLDKTKTGKTG